MFKLKIAAIGAALLGILVAFLKAFNAGKKTQKAEQNEQIIDDVARATKARNDYDSNPDVAKRVRDRFTRK